QTADRALTVIGKLLDRVLGGVVVPCHAVMPEECEQLVAVLQQPPRLRTWKIRASLGALGWSALRPLGRAPPRLRRRCPLFVGTALCLGSVWALIPAALASALRTLGTQ